MEGELLPREASRPRDAQLLRQAVFDRRDQPQFLQDAHRNDAAKLGKKRPGRLPVRFESEPADHAYQEAPQLRGDAEAFFGGSQRARGWRPSRAGPGATPPYV